MKLLAALAFVALSGVPSSVVCPLDNNQMIWTGQTRFEWGHMLYQYRCPVGHTTWIVVS